MVSCVLIALPREASGDKSYSDRGFLLRCDPLIHAAPPGYDVAVHLDEAVS